MRTIEYFNKHNREPNQRVSCR